MALQVVEKPTTTGHYLESHGKALNFEDIDHEKQLFEVKKLGAAGDKNWEWAWARSVDKSVGAALSMLES